MQLGTGDADQDIEETKDSKGLDLRIALKHISRVPKEHHNINDDTEQEPNEILTARNNLTPVAKRKQDSGESPIKRLNNIDDTCSSCEDSEANDLLWTARKNLTPIDYSCDGSYEGTEDEPSELNSILKKRRSRMDETADVFVKRGKSASTDASYHSSSLDLQGRNTTCATPASSPVRWELGSESSDDECKARISMNSQRDLEWDFEDAFDAITKASFASTTFNSDISTTGDRGSSATSEGSRCTMNEDDGHMLSKIPEPLIATDFQDVVMQQVRENKAIKSLCLKVTLLCAISLAWLWGYGTAVYLDTTSVESTYPVSIIREMRQALELQFDHKAEIMQQEFNATLSFELNALESKHQDHLITVLSTKELEHREHIDRVLQDEKASHQLKLSEAMNIVKERQIHELQAAVSQAKALEVERWSAKMSQLQKQLAKDAVDYLASANEMLEAKYEADKQKLEAEKHRQQKETQRQLDELDMQKGELSRLNDDLGREKEELSRANEELGRDKVELSKDIEARSKENDRLRLEKKELLKAQGDLGDEYTRFASEANSTATTNMDQLLDLKKQAEKSEREKQDMVERLQEARAAYQKANENQNNHEFDINNLIKSGLTNLKLDDQIIHDAAGDFSYMSTSTPTTPHDTHTTIDMAAIEAVARAKALEEARGEISGAKEQALQDALRSKEQALRDALRAKEQAYAKARMDLQSEKDAVKADYEEVLAQKDIEKEQMLMAERAKRQDAEKREKLLSEEKERALTLAREKEMEGRTSRDVIEEMNLMQEQSNLAMTNEILSLKKKHQEELEQVNSDTYIGTRAERVSEFPVEFPFEGRLCLWMDPTSRPPTLGSFSPCVEEAWKKASPVLEQMSAAHPILFEQRDKGILINGELIEPPDSPWVRRSANWGLLSETVPNTNNLRLVGFADTSELWWRTQRIQLKDRLIKIEQVNLQYLTPTELAKLPEFQKRPLRMVFQRARQCTEKDAVDACAGWAENDECNGNPAYMCVHCPCSCACELKNK